MLPVLSYILRPYVFIRWCYFQFAIHTCVSMLEPVEERLLLLLLTSIAVMVTFVTTTYLPGHLIMLCNFTQAMLGI